MANDRVFLVCRHCEEGVYLAKWMANGWYRKEDDDRRAIGDTFVEFMDEHQWCGQSAGCWGSAHVEIVHEIPEELEGVTLTVPGCPTSKYVLNAVPPKREVEA
jgi:hypothetical protein